MALSEDYSKAMQAQMGSSLTYCHDDGMNFAKHFSRLFVGSCLQRAEDVDTLMKEGVNIIFCLQVDADMAYFSLDVEPIKARAVELGIERVQHPIQDFDPISLRRSLPAAVKHLCEAMANHTGSQAYIHCTAGLGRAPGVALAYMFWVEGMCLDEAYTALFEVRRCHPQIGMIRAATCDMLDGDEGSLQTVTLSISRKDASKVEIAGLDIGWKSRIELLKGTDEQWTLTKQIPPGRYQYKYVIDGDSWEPNMEAPTVNDNGNINNVLEVSSAEEGPAGERRARIMGEGGMPTTEEFQVIRDFLGTAQSK